MGWGKLEVGTGVDDGGGGAEADAPLVVSVRNMQQTVGAKA